MEIVLIVAVVIFLLTFFGIWWNGNRVRMLGLDVIELTFQSTPADITPEELWLKFNTNGECISADVESEVKGQYVEWKIVVEYVSYIHTNEYLVRGHEHGGGCSIQITLHTRSYHEELIVEQLKNGSPITIKGQINQVYANVVYIENAILTEITNEAS